MKNSLKRFVTVMLSVMLLATSTVPFAIASEPDVSNEEVQSNTEDLSLAEAEETEEQILAESSSAVEKEVESSTETETYDEAVSNEVIDSEASESKKEKKSKKNKETTEEVALNEEIILPAIKDEPESENTAEKMSDETSSADAITNVSIKRNPRTTSEKPIGNITLMETTFGFDVEKKLDRLEIVIKTNNTISRNLSILEIGDTEYSIYKYFKVVYLDDDGNTQTEYAAMPIAENLSGSKYQKIKGLDKDYFDFKGVDKNVDPVFIKEYRIVFENGIKSGKTIRGSIEGIMDSVDQENATLKINAEYTIKGETHTVEVGSARYHYSSDQDLINSQDNTEEEIDKIESENENGSVTEETESEIEAEIISKDQIDIITEEESDAEKVIETFISTEEVIEAEEVSEEEAVVNNENPAEDLDSLEIEDVSESASISDETITISEEDNLGEEIIEIEIVSKKEQESLDEKEGTVDSDPPLPKQDEETNPDVPFVIEGYIEINLTDDKNTPDDETDDTPVSGISFVIKDNNKIVETIETDAKGYAKSKIPLDEGVYTVEMKTDKLDAYVYTETVYQIQFAATETKTEIKTLDLHITSKNTIVGSIRVQAINKETKVEITGVIFDLYDDNNESLGTYTTTNQATGQYGIAYMPNLTYGEYTVTLNSVPEGYKTTTYSQIISITESKTYELKTLELEEEDPPIIYPDPEVVKYTSMEFDPSEITAVPNSPFAYNMVKYSLVYNEDIYSAHHVKYVIKQVTDDVQLRALFNGTVTDYQVAVVTAAGETISLEKTSNELGVVDFDSRLLPVTDQDGNVIEEATGSLPEDTEIIWLTVWEPSNDFSVNEFYVYRDMPEEFEDYSYTVETIVYEDDTAIMYDNTNTGKVTHGEAKIDLTLTSSVTDEYTQQPVKFSLDYTNVSQTAFKEPSITIQTPATFAPSLISIGTWTNYTGGLNVYTMNASGELTFLVKVDSVQNTEAITLNERGNITGVKLVPTEGFNGDEAITGVALEGLFSGAGDYKTYGIFNGTINSTMSTEKKVDVSYIIYDVQTPTPEPTPTPTPEPTPTSEPTATSTQEPDNTNTPEGTSDPVGEATEIPTTNPGGNSHVNPPSTATNTPLPTAVPLTLDKPSIYGNTNSIAYGDSAIYNVRNIGVVGMNTDNTYVLHLMIPTGVQIRSITLPEFGGSMRAFLAYSSGSANLGTFTEAQTISLSEKEGSNVLYIALQMRGVTEANQSGGEVSLLFKNISSRDRVATLTATLSVRDANTSVLQQETDKYNISLAGPKTTVTANTTTIKTSTNTSTSGTSGSVITDDESGNGIDTIYSILMPYNDTIPVVRIQQHNTETVNPLLMEPYGVVSVRQIKSDAISVYEIDNTRIEAYSKKLLEEIKIAEQVRIKYGNGTYVAIVNAEEAQ